MPQWMTHSHAYVGSTNRNQRAIEKKKDMEMEGENIGKGVGRRKNKSWNV